MHAILVLSAVSLALAAASAAVAGPAQAVRYQPARSGYAYGPPPHPRVVCQRICPKDMAPCDPISFKIADGRCNPGMREGL
jgi:hypothetical protein